MLIKSNIFKSNLWFKLSKNESHLYMILSIIYNQEKEDCWPGLRYLKKITKLNGKTLSKCIKTLEYYNLIKITKSRGKLNHYQVFEICEVSEGTTTLDPVINNRRVGRSTSFQEDRPTDKELQWYNHINSFNEELKNEYFRENNKTIYLYNRIDKFIKEKVNV